MKKWLKRIAIVFLSIVLILSIIPYAIPVSQYAGPISEKPFSESQLVEVDGLQMHYRRFMPSGEKALGKIVLIHGLGGSTFSWRNNIEALQEEGYMVIAADLPGFGYSDKKPGVDHSQKNRSRILWELLDQIDGTLDPELGQMDWNLLGHSMGGGSVLAMAREKPEKVQQLILVAPALFDNNPQFVSQILAYPPLARWGQVIAENVILDPERIRSFLSFAYGREPSDQEVQGHLVPLDQGGSGLFFIDLTKSAKSEAVDKLKNVDYPISVIFGGNDQSVPIEQMDAFQEIIGPIDLVIINEAGHCPNETHAAEFNAILRGFLSELENQ